jgi:type I restriction enzyme M protein
MIDRVHRELTDDDVKKITDTYHAWRGDAENETYTDIQGFCKSASIDEIRSFGYVLTPGRYVGAEEVEDDGEPFAEKMQRLTKTLSEQFAKSDKLEEEIKKNLKKIGFEL